MALIASAVVAVLGGWEIERGYDQAVANAFAQAESLSRSLAEHSERTFEAVSIVLDGLVDRSSHGALADPATLQTFLGKRSATITQASALVVMDAHGDWIVEGGEPAKPGLNSADQDFFRWHLHHDMRPLHIGLPIVSQIDGRWTIPLSMRWNKPDGAFGGVVLAYLKPEYFERFYQRVGAGNRGLIQLLSDQRRYLARQPEVPGHATGSLIPSPTLLKAWEGAPQGRLRYRSYYDGLDRIAAFEHLKAYPVTVIAAVSAQDALAPWRRDAIVQVGAVLIATSLLMMLGIGAARHRRATDRVERALAESERRYRLLAENANDMITQSDLDYRRLYVSSASDDLLGYRPEELIGTRPQDMTHPDEAAQLRDTLRLLCDGQIDKATSTHRFRRKDGSFVWVEAQFRLIRDALTNQPSSFVSVVRDVTDRKQVELALVEAKTAAEDARREAEHASLAKSEFLATMSHEIRTPLNGIVGYTDLLMEETPATAPSRRKLEIVQESSAALLTIVNDILDFSKIEAGQVELAPAPFAPRALVANVGSMLSSVAARKGLEMALDVADDVPAFVLGDENRLRQVLLNLANNAIKFSSKGSITIAVRRRSATPRSDRADLLFSVQDHGIGIPAAQQERLFKRFSQVDGSISRRFGGTGLGLALCKQLVELMGGKIGVRSDEGQGSTFWFALALPLTTKPEPNPILSGASRPMDGGARILLVEDVEVNQDLAKAILERNGHFVSLASNGAEAVKMVQSATYDIVLMDVHMPVMDGIAATQAIRAGEDSGRRLPIVAMTANVLPDQVASFRKAGMDDHVGKPFRRAELEDAISRWVRPDAAPPTAPEEKLVDQDVLLELQDMIGPEHVLKMVLSLARELTERFEDLSRPELSRDRLSKDAHALISATASLGFTDLSTLCRDMESRCLNGADLAEVINRLSRARTRALAELMRMETQLSAQQRVAHAR